ncbi:glutamate dehydrogenase [Polaribacter sp. WD7]|uniref:LysE family transporter n=1 Tax=Polaribacter sp. WD7 TaxID=2269061 RepID=UPI000DF32AEC|nr:LysE family transporter [Polaribacter sp. WD7]RCS26047.1 glutamate dehydrogenase [Polaribacter sp. WD7]
MILLFFLGIFFSFLGYTPPSVLNMTALKIRLHGDKKEFNKFMFGALSIVLFQAYLSVYLTKYVAGNQSLLIILQKIGIIVLLLLSIYFYKLNKKEKTKNTASSTRKNPFVAGLVLSSLNMFAIPFFSGIIAFLGAFNLMDFNGNSIFLFVAGSVVGTYYILYLYGKYAHKIQEKAGKLTNNINLILSYITAVFALFTLLKLAV